MKKKQIEFILDHKLMSYRVPFFEQLAERGYDITIIHPGPIIEGVNLIKQKLSSTKRITKGLEYRLYKRNIYADIVVYMQNLRIVNFWICTLFPFKKYKLVHWGIGVSSSNGLSLNKTITARVRDFLSRFASALILYTDFPLTLFSNSVQKKIFIANNTIYNSKMADFSSEDKSSFLFIGTLNKRKGLDDLLLSFAELIQIRTETVQLDILGEGEEKARLIEMARDLGISERVNFLGQVLSSEEKEIYFKRALISISPKQAGLSVLESFSYGVPFIAYKNAISGGEHLNIIDGYNGYLLNSRGELTNRMKEVLSNRQLARTLGCNSFQYYKNNRQMKHMVDSFEAAFNYIKDK